MSTGYAQIFPLPTLTGAQSAQPSVSLGLSGVHAPPLASCWRVLGRRSGDDREGVW
jgi:hypothetical protein